MKCTFKKNINNMGYDGIIDIEKPELLCICSEKQAEIILQALDSSQPAHDGWVRVDDALPDYRLVVDVYKSHHNVVEPAARLSTDITGEKWSCEYGHYITHWRLRPEPPKQTV